MAKAEPPAEALIVGAGPTGLTLAVEMHAAGVPFRIIDAAATPVHESRALAIQARTLEVLDRSGIASELVAAGDRARVIVLHASRDVTVPLFDDATGATSYPFLLFLSQAETERILLQHLEQAGVRVERNATLAGVVQQDDGVTFELETPSGREVGRASYLIGCDGAHSAVRTSSGIEFSGSGFPQSFAIADLEVDGLIRDQVHAFVSGDGIMFFFPLGSPASWRLLAMLPDSHSAAAPDLGDLQALVDSYLGKSNRVLRLHDPVWVTRFSVESRRAERFRRQRVFLAGDAAHIHSPAGAQGMNTGIQDAVNLGWKLAQVGRGLASQALLDSYEDERLPVARGVLRMTNRLFRMATTRNRLVGFLRPRLAPVVLGLVVRSGFARRIGFRTISQIGLGYRGGRLASSARGDRFDGLRPGDRLPDMNVIVDGEEVNLRRKLVSPGYLLAAFNAPTGLIDEESLDRVTVLHCDLSDPKRRTGRLRLLLVRPDGYIAGVWRNGEELSAFLRAWS